MSLFTTITGAQAGQVHAEVPEDGGFVYKSTLEGDLPVTPATVADFNRSTALGTNTVGNASLAQNAGATVLTATSKGAWKIFAAYDAAVTDLLVASLIVDTNGKLAVAKDADSVGTDLTVDAFGGTELAAGAAGGNFGNQPANDGVEIVSDAAGDTTQSITIIGTTNGGNTVVVETVALTGTSQASTVKTDWGEILAVKLSAACAGTVTVREASANATIITLTAGQLSKGVVTPDETDGADMAPWVVAGGASTKKVGIRYLEADGDTAYQAVALNGTTPVQLTTQIHTLVEFYVGDVATATTTSLKAGGGVRVKNGNAATRTVRWSWNRVV